MSSASHWLRRVARRLLTAPAAPPARRPRLGLERLEDRSVPAATPWGGAAVAFPHGPDPLAVQAEDYDLGGPGVAYSDTTPGNSGNAYRAGEAVDVGTDGTGHAVGWTAAGEWLGYTVAVEHEHRYDFTARVSSGAVPAGATAGWFHLEFGPVGQVGGAGVIKTELFVVTGTGGWNAFADVSLKGVKLPAGTHWMRLVQDTGGYNVDSITVQSTPHTHHEDMYNDVTDVVSDGATHTAVNGGNWASGSTWNTGTVPGANARVRVPPGFAVTYNVASSPARLTWVRVEGTLSFATGQDTQMLVDSLVAMPGGTLNVGTSSTPVDAAYRALIQFRSDTALNLAQDKAAMGKGLLSEGTVNVHGAAKADWVTMNAVSAGATSLTLDSAPAGWRVGDKLVIAGTSYNANGSDADNTRYRDEELTVTGISGNTVTFTNRHTSGNGLRFDHVPPGGYGFKVYVGNLTRNVVFETENWQSAATPDSRRGHTLFTADSVTSLNNAGFYGLGRTNKTVPVTDPNKTGDGGATYANPRGRYPVHFHHVNNLNLTAEAARVDGCAVDNSSGWGFTLHSSKGDFNSNVSYDVLGAHFMTEEGVELGSFTNNLAIKAVGTTTRNNDLGNGRTIEPNAAGNAAGNHDFGFLGNGFWIQGGGLFRTDGNVAASTYGPAFEVYGDADDRNNFRNKVNPDNIADAALKADLVAAYGATEIYAWQVPWASFKDNVAFNTYAGFQYGWQLREANRPRSPARNVLDGFKAWGIYGSISQNGGSVRSGSAVSFVYSGFLSVKNAVLVGTSTGVADPTSPTERVRIGIDVNYNARSITIENSTVVGFDQGVLIPFDGDQEVGAAPFFRDSRIIGGTFNNRVNLLPGERLDPNNSFQPVPNPTFSYLELLNSPSFTVQGSNTAPTASFTSSAADGLAVRFDGGGSSDPDAATTSGNRIAAYGWDFDNNGTIDAWGMRPSHTFASAGSRTVRLTVWDNKGATGSTTGTVAVAASQVNAVPNGDFAANTFRQYSHVHSVTLFKEQAGWFTHSDGPAWTRESDGTIRAVADAATAGVTQYLRDDKAHRGSQQVRFDYRNTEGGGAGNRLRVLVWGINTHPQPRFDHDAWHDNYSAAGAIMAKPFGTFAFSAVTLLDSGDVANGTTGWTTYSATADFGSGYDFLVVRFEQDDVGPADLVSVDNVSIRLAGSVSPPVTPPPPPPPPPTSGGFSDGEFAAVSQGNYVSGASALNQWHSQAGSSHAARTASGGNTGAYLGLGLYGSQAVLGRAAPSAPEVWTVQFDLLAPQSWGGPAFRVFGLAAGQSLGYAYGGGSAGTQLASHNLGTAASWTAVSFSVTVPAGFQSIALVWWGDLGVAGGIDNVRVTPPNSPPPPPPSTTVLDDGTFANLNQGNFVAGTSTLGQWYSQFGTSHATRPTSGGNGGDFLQLGLYGNQVAVGVAAPTAAQTWTASFDWLYASGWGARFRVLGLTNGQSLAYAYGGGTAGTQLFQSDLSAQAAWGNKSFSFAVPAGFDVIVLEWWGDAGGLTGIDNARVTRS